MKLIDLGYNCLSSYELIRENKKFPRKYLATLVLLSRIDTIISECIFN